MHDIIPVTTDTIEQVIELVLKVFTSDVAREMPAEGVETFNSSSPAEQRKGLAEGQVFLAAMVESRVVGVTRINDKGHLYLLFVDAQHQERGIGKSLLRAGLRELKRRQPELECITLNASPNAIDIYRHWGGTVTGKMIEKRGIRALPMTMRINDLLQE